MRCAGRLICVDAHSVFGKLGQPDESFLMFDQARSIEPGHPA